MTNFANAHGYFTPTSAPSSAAAGRFVPGVQALSGGAGRYVPGSQLLASATGVFGFDVVTPPAAFLYVAEDYVDPDYVE